MGKELDPKAGGTMDLDAAPGAAKKKADAGGAGAAPPSPPSVPAVLAAAAALMDRAAKAKDVRGLPNRALRLTAGARARFDGPSLTEFLEGVFPPSDEARGVLSGAVAQVRLVGGGVGGDATRAPWRDAGVIGGGAWPWERGGGGGARGGGGGGPAGRRPPPPPPPPPGEH